MSFPGLSPILRRTLLAAQPAFRSRAYASKLAPAKASNPNAPSSCTPDTVLVGVNYLKGQAPVLAKPDEEYPDWLWNVLKPRVWPEDGPGGRAERAERRKENKRRIRDANFMSTQ